MLLFNPIISQGNDDNSPTPPDRSDQRRATFDSTAPPRPAPRSRHPRSGSAGRSGWRLSYYLAFRQCFLKILHSSVGDFGRHWVQPLKLAQSFEVCQSFVATNKQLPGATIVEPRLILQRRGDLLHGQGVFRRPQRVGGVGGDHSILQFGNACSSFLTPSCVTCVSMRRSVER